MEESLSTFTSQPAPPAPPQIGEQRPVEGLLIEDNRGDARLLQELLREDGSRGVRLAWEQRLDDGLRRLGDDGFDVVLLDLGLPDSQGLDTLASFRRVEPSTPVVILTGLDDQQTALAAMRAGAQDYLAKGDISGRELRRVLRHAVERHSLQSRLQAAQQERLETMDRFFSHISHELRTPLATVHQFVTLLLDGLAGELQEEQREYLDVALRNVHQLRRLIDDLLEATRAHNGKLRIHRKPCDPGLLLRQAAGDWRPALEEAGLHLELDLPRRLPSLWADPDRLRQVLDILLDNARKYTPAGGEVVIATDPADDDAEELIVSVSDTGPGVPREDRERIFDRLEQSGRRGTSHGIGLGLFIARQIVGLHGGRIWVSSRPGDGSRFQLALPTRTLAGLLGPILGSENLARSDYSLLHVTLRRRDGAPLVSRDRQALDRAHQAIHNALTPALDVLLPRRARTASGERFALFATTGEQGAQVLARRIAALVEDRIQPAEHGLELSIETHSRHLPLEEAGEAAEIRDELVRWVSALSGPEAPPNQEEPPSTAHRTTGDER